MKEVDFQKLRLHYFIDFLCLEQSDESSYFVPILPALPIKNKMASLKRKCLEPVESIHEAKSGKGLEADSSEEETFGKIYLLLFQLMIWSLSIILRTRGYSST